VGGGLLGAIPLLFGAGGGPGAVLRGGASIDLGRQVARAYKGKGNLNVIT